MWTNLEGIHITDSVQQRMQQAIDRFLAGQPTAQIAIIPEAPYTPPK